MKHRFAGKTVLLAVTGSIAAYKACELASRLVEYGAMVLPALTRSARELIGPATLEAITGNRAILDLFAPYAAQEIEHIAVARRADLFLVAPATANILAKAAHGIADDWISTTLLATRAPILFAPAMNNNMYEHPATQANIELLRQRGVLFVGPGMGRLACGAEGPGRLIEIPAILEAAAAALTPKKDLAGKRVLITSGANHEPIDPVRFLGNASSGRMGRAVALAALCRGAEVTVISGPASVALPQAARTIPVTTALEMQAAVQAHFSDCDIFIGAAAVADYRPSVYVSEKHKRDKADWALTLTANPDIIAGLASLRRPDQKLVGFAAESADVLENGQAKLQAKGLDLLLANRIGGEAGAIGAAESDAWLISATAPPEALGRMAKQVIAERIFDAVVRLSL